GPTHGRLAQAQREALHTPAPERLQDLAGVARRTEEHGTEEVDRALQRGARERAADPPEALLAEVLDARVEAQPLGREARQRRQDLVEQLRVLEVHHQ